MARLTNDIRRVIKERAVKFATDSKFKEIDRKRMEFGEKVYDAIVGPYLNEMEKLPEGFFKKQDEIDFYLEGGYRKIHFKEEKLIPHRYLSSKGLMVGNSWNFSVEFLAIEDEYDIAKKTRTTLEKQIDVVLDSVTTTDRLKRVWPEVEPFLGGLEAKEVYLPMVQVSVINDIITAFKHDEEQLEEEAA